MCAVNSMRIGDHNYIQQYSCFWMSCIPEITAKGLCLYTELAAEHQQFLTSLHHI